MGTWSLRFRSSAEETEFAQLEEPTFKSNVMCCLVLWALVVAVQVIMYCRSLEPNNYLNLLITDF